MILSQTQAHNKQISPKPITTKVRKKGKGGKCERNHPDALKSHSLVLEEAFWSGIKTNNDCTHEYIKKISGLMVVVKDQLHGHHLEVVSASLLFYSNYPENEELSHFFFWSLCTPHVIRWPNNCFT